MFITVLSLKGVSQEYLWGPLTKAPIQTRDKWKEWYAQSGPKAGDLQGLRTCIISLNVHPPAMRNDFRLSPIRQHTSSGLVTLGQSLWMRKQLGCSVTCTCATAWTWQSWHVNLSFVWLQTCDFIDILLCARKESSDHRILAATVEQLKVALRSSPYGLILVGRASVVILRAYSPLTIVWLVSW